MDTSVGTNKLAPLKMVHFIAELLIDLSSRSKVVSVEVEGNTYMVTVSRQDGGLAVHQLSAWDVSRSMRGDPDALAALRAGFERHARGA